LGIIQLGLPPKQKDRKYFKRHRITAIGVGKGGLRWAHPSIAHPKFK